MPDLSDLRQRAVGKMVGQKFYCSFMEWDEFNPRPVSAEHGPQQTPPVWVWSIDDATANPAVHVMLLEIPAGAAWESPLHSDNQKALALGEYIAALLNEDHTRDRDEDRP